MGATANISTADAAETATTSQSTNEVYNEFIQAGGTKSLWDNVVMPESSGNP
ncbi:Probable transglycosylase isaA precursor [Staphylococcus gallinarum]|uniref:Probable transglycosylase isaA n=1 Tax=Staphylococcus gallinarum TaxID=1293 RepID=A0A380FNN5_STAGA|nr:Probable transglycosylase isaA precursor [Staphylococcus gallinarum]